MTSLIYRDVKRSRPQGWQSFLSAVFSRAAGRVCRFGQDRQEIHVAQGGSLDAALCKPARLDWVVSRLPRTGLSVVCVSRCQPESAP